MSYEITGNRHMGSCMKKKQAQINEWKLKSRRKIMPGYPIEEPFETREQIENYLNCDRLICLLCGKTYKSLCGHLSVHGTNADDYKEKYGLPWGCGLTCISTKEMNINHGKRLVIEGIFKPPTPKERKQIMKNKAKPRNKAVFIINECKERISGKQPEKFYTDGHYSKILQLAEENNCHPTDICRKNNGDLPSLSLLHKYKSENPEFKTQYDFIVDKLPKHVRMKHGKQGNKYEEQIRKLKEEYKTNAEISKIMGVHEITIEKYCKKFGIKKHSPLTCQSGLHPYPGYRIKCQPCNTINSRKYHGTMDRNISKAIIIDRPCTDCGTIVQVSRLYGTIKPKYCESCKKKRYYESQNKYAKEKRPFLKR